jgi:hypothetical protein
MSREWGNKWATGEIADPALDILSDGYYRRQYP